MSRLFAKTKENTVYVVYVLPYLCKQPCSMQVYTMMHGQKNIRLLNVRLQSRPTVTQKPDPRFMQENFDGMKAEDVIYILF